MSGCLLAVIVVIALLAGFSIAAFGGYNSLVTLSEEVESGKADIQTQLQRRADLIPNLVNTAKGYAAHEEAVFTALAESREKLAAGGSMTELAAANDELTGAVNRLIALTESYPELKSDTQYTALMDELAGTENRIAVSRRNYNESVQTYNEKLRRFPNMIYAAVFGFQRAEYFEAGSDAQEAPLVDFGA